MGDLSFGFVVVNSRVIFKPPNLKCCATLASLSGERRKATNA